MKHIKKELRYIRYRICRNIYYADQCPKDCRKNFKEIAKNLAGMALVCMMVFFMACLFVLMA
jgi:hypothetical protein